MTDDQIRIICCGSQHSMILKNNGEFYVCGLNDHGQLGLGNNKDQNSPVLMMVDPEIKLIDCGVHFTLIYKKNGDLFAFGCNFLFFLFLDFLR